MRALELLWIVLFRFKPIARIWVVCLMLINVASVFFLNTFYGWFNLIAVCVGISIMTAIYVQLGFVRLLGIGHVLWIPMVACFLADLPDRYTQPSLFYWVVSLVTFNSISLVIDTIDVARYWGGDRKPYYEW